MESEPNQEIAQAETAEAEVSFVVAIGASAGGLDAVTQFFRNMPIDTGISFVIIQHLSPDFKSFMPELLGRETKMNIQVVQESLEIAPNSIYLIPPRHNIALENGRFLLTEQDNKSSLNLPIDIFFRSLADDMGPRAIGIILSGTGADGSRGVQEIWDNGGFVIAQEPETAQFDSMPVSAIDTKKVHLISAPDDMPQHIEDYVGDRHSALESIQLKKESDSHLNRIFSLLMQQFSVNFNQYRSGTIMRRLERRLIKTESANLEEYYQFLREYPDEINVLFHDLIITVTSFFRDREAFNYLSDNIFPDLIDNANKNNQPIRIWVTACSSGEEAYTIAMLLNDIQSEQNLALDIKIFATDVNQTMLQKANLGIYTHENISAIPPYYREKYFSQQKDGYKIQKSIRDMIIFAPHNLLQNPPFTKLDFVSCRNLLIYLNPPVQRRILSYIHFGMKVGGVLFLGPSETIGALENEFEQLEKRWRIFRKRRDVRLSEAIEAMLSSSSLSFRNMEKMSPKTAELFKRNAWQEILLNSLISSGLLLDETFQLMHIFGDAGSYLQQPSGSPTLNVLQMVDQELRAAIQSGVNHLGQIQEEGLESIEIRNISNPLEFDQMLSLSIIRLPLERQEINLYLVRFETSVLSTLEETVVPFNALNLSTAVQTRVQELEKELFSVRNSLQITMEELETTNEELQSTNEELIASNEQLQGTNEELHSVNEELHMVNAEYRQKIIEMVNLNDQMQNLQRSSQIITIFLDGDLNIRVFTPEAADLFSLMPQDVGRPVTHLLYMLQLDNRAIEKIVHQVLINEATVEQELQLRNGRYYLMRVLPYMREGKPSGGLVINLVEFTSLRKMNALELQSAVSQLPSIIETYHQFFESIGAVSMPVDRQGQMEAEHTAWEALTGQTWPVYEGLGWIAKVHPSDQSSLHERWQTAVNEATLFQTACRLWHAAKDTYQPSLLHAFPKVDQPGDLTGWQLFWQPQP